MKKVLVLFGMLSYSLLSAAPRIIHVINNTGATLHAKLTLAGCKPIEIDIKSNPDEIEPQPISIGACCLMGIDFKVTNGRYTGKSAKAYGAGEPKHIESCREATFEVEIKNDELIWFRK